MGSIALCKNVPLNVENITPLVVDIEMMFSSFLALHNLGNCVTDKCNFIANIIKNPR